MAFKGHDWVGRVYKFQRVGVGLPGLLANSEYTVMKFFFVW